MAPKWLDGSTRRRAWLGLILTLAVGAAVYRGAVWLAGEDTLVSSPVTKTSSWVTLLAGAVGPDTRPDLVVVVLDTTRRDRLSLYGYERPTTPNLLRLAAESTVWESAYSTSSWTSPAHATLFTGLYPSAHGVTQSAWDMPDALETLAERLSAAGYRTIGIVGNPMVGRAFGFDQGFDEYHETWREKRSKGRRHPALRHFERVLDDGDARPLFVFVNLIEPHSPYTSGASHHAAFVRHPEIALFKNYWEAFYAGETSFSAKEVEHLGDLYDAGLRYVDGVVGDLERALRERGRLDATALVVTADHGENLGEHDMFDHVFSLYEPTVRIPLLIRYPNAFRAGERVHVPVQLNDVYLTLVNLAGVAAGPSQGFDLRSAAFPQDRPVVLSYDYPRQALQVMGERADRPALDAFKRRLWALREGPLKLIVSDDGQLELYDLEADPDELDDLAAQQPGRAQELRARLLKLVGTRVVVRDVPSPALDRETTDELRRLGYLGDASGAGDVSDRAEAKRPNAPGPVPVSE